MFDIILDENQLEDACEHMADYLEAYWKSTHPTSCNPPNPLLSKLPTATLPSSPAPVSGVQVQVLSKLRASGGHGEGRDTCIRAVQMNGITQEVTEAVRKD